MKSIIIVGILSLVFWGQNVSAGIRVVRDADDDMAKMEEKKVAGHDDDNAGADAGHKTTDNLNDIRSIITGALTRLRTRVGDHVKEDIDMLQKLVNMGALDKTLDQVKTDLQGQGASIRKIITTFRERAASEYSELISRIVTGSQSTLEKLQERAHSLVGGRIAEGVKAVAAGISEITGM